MESYPLREGAAALTMWSQATAGAPSEALRTYDDMRRALRDELGMDPSPLLRDMHRRVLRADPALGPPSATAAVELPVTSVGRQGLSSGATRTSSVLPADLLPPDRALLLVQRTVLARPAEARRRYLRLVSEAPAATGVRLAPWEQALVR